jgi:hypothetical protein
VPDFEVVPVLGMEQDVSVNGWSPPSYADTLVRLNVEREQHRFPVHELCACPDVQRGSFTDLMVDLWGLGIEIQPDNASAWFR